VESGLKGGQTEKKVVVRWRRKKKGKGKGNKGGVVGKEETPRQFEGWTPWRPGVGGELRRKR